MIVIVIGYIESKSLAAWAVVILLMKRTRLWIAQSSLQVYLLCEAMRDSLRPVETPAGHLYSSSSLLDSSLLGELSVVPVRGHFVPHLSWSFLGDDACHNDCNLADSSSELSLSLYSLGVLFFVTVVLKLKWNLESLGLVEGVCVSAQVAKSTW